LDNILIIFFATQLLVVILLVISLYYICRPRIIQVSSSSTDTKSAGRVMITPKGTFDIIDEKAKRSPVVNSDEKLWLLEQDE